jgi:NADPH-dependent methylglyoxal reductase
MDSIARHHQTILITGVSGFVGGWITDAFLQAGYHVRGTVRSQSSVERVKNRHAGQADQLSFAIVPDMAAPNALHDAVKGVSGVIHTANPFVLDPKDNEEELLKPSVNGVLEALKAAQTQGSAIRRVVLLASFADEIDISKGMRPGFTYDETIWNPATWEDAKKSDSGAFVYCAAKALAERAAWDWIEENKPAFSFVALTPPWIFGPTLGGISSLDHLNESTQAIWKLINGSAKAVPGTEFGGFCDVRDIGAFHLKAYETEEAAGHRIITGSHFDYQTAVDLLREEFPQLSDRIPKGNTGIPEETYAINHSKAEQLLGAKFTPLRKTLRDTVEGLLEAEMASSA